MADVDARLIGGEKAAVQLRFTAKGIYGAALMFGQIGSLLVANIKVRTGEGKDVDGNAFEPYVPSYAAYRKEQGRPTSPVDLFFTGTMLNSLTYEFDRNRVRAFFMPVQDKFGTPSPIKAYSLNIKRRFFGFSKKDVQDIREIAQQYIRGLIAKGGKSGGK